VPNALTRWFMALLGKSWAYETVDQVREAIAKNSFDSLAERAQEHAKGAAGLTDSYALQPGLIDLHDEMVDVWHYLIALKERANQLGNATLTDDLHDAANSVRDVLVHVADAAEATVPAPEVPLTR
jgi:urate oxidase